MQRVDSLEKILMLGKIEGGRRRRNDRGWDGWMASLTWWTWVWVGSGSLWWRGNSGLLQWGHKELNTTEPLNLARLKNETRICTDIFPKKIFKQPTGSTRKMLIITRETVFCSKFYFHFSFKRLLTKEASSYTHKQFQLFTDHFLT